MRKLAKQKPTRLDLRIGFVASAVALLGLAVSVFVGNEDGGLFGQISSKDQIGLLIAAVLIFVLTAWKLREYRRSMKP